jgi:hypothetical protein
VIAVFAAALGSVYGQSFSACGVNICAPYGTWLGLTHPPQNGNLVVVEGSLSDSYANSGVGGLRFARGSGQPTDESLIFGVHNGDYNWIQAVEPGWLDGSKPLAEPQRRECWHRDRESAIRVVCERNNPGKRGDGEYGLVGLRISMPIVVSRCSMRYPATSKRIIISRISPLRRKSNRKA